MDFGTSPGRWHHQPQHRFMPCRTYMVTASTAGHVRFFEDATRLAILQRTLLTSLSRFGWTPEAWVVLPNHYHVVAVSPENAESLRSWVTAAHANSARELNRLDDTPGRQVWFQYWDTCITHEASYFARLHYVLENPVKHGYVQNAETWPFGSAGELLGRADPAFMARVMSYGCGRVHVPDAF